MTIKFNPLEDNNKLNNGSSSNCFFDLPIWYLFRESIQNSVDAYKDWNKNPGIAKINFRRFSIPTKDMPHIKDFKIHNEYMKNSTHYSGNNKEFYKRRKKALDKDEQNIICISDYGKGMTVDLDDETEGTLAKYIRSSNSTDKTINDGTGGNFGEGSNAPFAASDLDTVFVSTYEDTTKGIKPYFLGQAKTYSRHNDDYSKMFSNQIFWSNEDDWGNGYGPEKDFASFPNWAKRSDLSKSGSDIYSIGVNDNSWLNKGIISILCNYSLEILRANLEINLIDDIDNKKLTLNKGNIVDQFDDFMTKGHQLHKTLEEMGKIETFIEAYFILKIESSDNDYSKTIEIQNDRAGKCVLKIKFIEENDIKKIDEIFDNLETKIAIPRNSISFYRKGMLICNNKNKAESLFDLKRFKGINQFLGFIEIDKEKEFEKTDYYGESLFQSAEPETHDNLIYDRIINSCGREEAEKIKKCFKKISSDFKKQLVKLSENEFDQSAAGLLSVNDLFSVEGLKYETGPKTFVDAELEGSYKINKSTFPWWTKSNSGGGGSGGLKITKFANIPNFVVKDVSNPNIYKFEFEKPNSKDLDISIQISGNNDDETLKIRKVHNHTSFTADKIQNIKGSIGTTVKLDVEFDFSSPPNKFNYHFKIQGQEK